MNNFTFYEFYFSVQQHAWQNKKRAILSHSFRFQVAVLSFPIVFLAKSPGILKFSHDSAIWREDAQKRATLLTCYLHIALLQNIVLESSKSINFMKQWQDCGYFSENGKKLFELRTHYEISRAVFHLRPQKAFSSVLNFTNMLSWAKHFKRRSLQSLFISHRFPSKEPWNFKVFIRHTTRYPARSFTWNPKRHSQAYSILLTCFLMQNTLNEGAYNLSSFPIVFVAKSPGILKFSHDSAIWREDAQKRATLITCYLHIVLLQNIVLESSKSINYMKQWQDCGYFSENGKKLFELRTHYEISRAVFHLRPQKAFSSVFDSTNMLSWAKHFKHFKRRGLQSFIVSHNFPSKEPCNFELFIRFRYLTGGFSKKSNSSARLRVTTSEVWH